MVYHAIGTMSGSSMDGLDIVYASIEEIGGQWSYQIIQADCIPFPSDWSAQLSRITSLSAKELLLAHTAFGKWMGHEINLFIQQYQLEHKIHLIASHGHTVFHEPALGMTFQMGDGASIAAITQLPVVSDLRNMDIALGGQGAPIVPIGEKLFWKEYAYFLNIGGIANISIHQAKTIAFDVCPANRVLNLLANELGKSFDAQGEEASKGTLNLALLNELNDLDYYTLTPPKSLSNEFGIDTVFALIQASNLSIQDKLCTMCHHIAKQIAAHIPASSHATNSKMLITGGGALNTFLIDCIRQEVKTKQIEVDIPPIELIQNKEALVMALIGVLRWREEENVLSSVTGASRSSVGGALWMGQV